MSDDARVRPLVLAAAPPEHKILATLGRCKHSGRKHSYNIVAGGTQKQHIGLLLDLCTNPRGQRCDANLKPLAVQMSLANRVGLLLELAALDPPPFQSEVFARWCCEAAVSLLARDTQAQTRKLHLAPGMFLAFSPSIPGLDDLPPLEQDFLRRPYQTVARGSSSVIAPDGEDVEVVVVIYQMDHIGPMRIVAKGKKLGALVGFTFRQPAILQALGLPSKSRELGSYLMYEPFQRAWTETVKPSQTVTLCEGGGVMYRHPRVRVTLWLDHYVKEIYPDWTRRNSALLELAKLASERQPVVLSALKTAVTASSSTFKTTVPSAFKAGASSAFKAGASSASMTTVPSTTKCRTVIDLTRPARPLKPKPLKRKRPFVKPSQMVEIGADDGGRRAKAKRVRTGLTVMKLEGKGTETEPYIL